MKSLKTIDQKIEDLKKKKSELETKVALQLYKKLKTTLGEEFSPNIILGMINNTWENATPKMKEVWLQKAEPFRNSRKSQQEE